MGITESVMMSLASDNLPCDCRFDDRSIFRLSSRELSRELSRVVHENYH
jgi:hypothetical protein